MSLMIFTNDYKPWGGGAAELAHGMAVSLHGRGLRVTVVAPHAKGSEEFDKRQPFPIVRIWQPLIPHWGVIPMTATFAWLLFRHRPGHVHAMIWLPCGLICWVLSRLFRIGYSVTGLGFELLESSANWKHRLKKLLAPLKRRVFRQANFVAPISEYSASLIEDFGVPRERLRVLPPGCDVGRLDAGKAIDVRSRYGIAPGAFLILTVARLRHYKGQDMVIKALPRLLSVQPHVHYLVVGTGSHRGFLENLARDLGVSGNVTFAGFVPDKELPAYYRACDLFAMLSRMDAEQSEVEGFGISYLEASALGKPILGGRSGGVPDAVRDGISGILVDPEDAAAIEGALARLLSEPRLAQALGEGGKRWVREEMDWKALAPRYAELFGAALAIRGENEVTCGRNSCEESVRERTQREE